MKALEERHILALSGGKDSAALAVYMQEKHPTLPLEYVFIDSGYELPETYDFINRIKAILNISITTIGGAEDGKNFEWWLDVKNNYLPSAKNRWCTEILKIIPYNKWINKRFSNEIVNSYVGLRSDEKRERKGNLSARKNFYQHYPFIEDGLRYEDIKYLLENSGLGFPAYYKWRSRSGCFFCFYQSKQEWIGLYENHKNLFLKAASMEKLDAKTGKNFTWQENKSLMNLIEEKDDVLHNSKDFVHGEEKRIKLSDSIKSFYTGNSLYLEELIKRPVP